ncbi:nephrin [Trichonephila clavipes]|nr:nephrin [Trichonephila clavipes]
MHTHVLFLKDDNFAASKMGHRPWPKDLRYVTLVVQIIDEAKKWFFVVYAMTPIPSHQVNYPCDVPPKNLTIRDSKNNSISGVIGPYEEGAKVSLICEASGGRPTPSLSWWKGSTLLDESYTTLGRGLVKNELVLINLQREDLLATLTCQAKNTNLTIPVSKSVTIDLSLSPQEVKIITPRRPLSSGETLEVVCQTFGSRPPARLSWWIGQESLNSMAKETVSGDGNSTVSRLQFRPTSEEHGKLLICKAHNPETPDSALEDKWDLNVYFAPQLSLALGASQQYEHIREGSDVYFDCNIQANPPVTSVTWKLHSRSLEHQPAAGIIIRNHSLLLQSVGRRHRGKYRCLATNSEGEGISEEAELMVQFPCLNFRGRDRCCHQSIVKIYRRFENFTELNRIVTSMVIKAKAGVSLAPCRDEFRGPRSDYEAKARHRVSLVSAHVTTLEEDLKQQPLFQDSPKDVLSDSGLEIELAIPFVPNRDPPDTPQQSELGEGSCIIIHQNEVVTYSSSIWADICIKIIIPLSKTSYGSSMEHMQVSVATERDPCPNQDSTTFITVSFNSVGLMVSSALFPPDQ